VSVVSDQEVVNTLHLMHRAADQPITLAVARDLCQRAGSAAVLAGF